MSPRHENLLITKKEHQPSKKLCGDGIIPQDPCQECRHSAQSTPLVVVLLSSISDLQWSKMIFNMQVLKGSIHEHTQSYLMERGPAVAKLRCTAGEAVLAGRCNTQPTKSGEQGGRAQRCACGHLFTGSSGRVLLVSSTRCFGARRRLAGLSASTVGDSTLLAGADPLDTTVGGAVAGE